MAYRWQGVADESEDWTADEGKDRMTKTKLSIVKGFQNLFFSLIFQLCVSLSLSFFTGLKISLQI